MTALPNIISLPKDRVLRCPRLLELVGIQLDVSMEIVASAFYDMLELTIIDPENNPDFSWFIVSEDESDPDMIWFINDGGTQLAYKLDDGELLNDEFKSTVPLNIKKDEFDTMSELSMAITDALREKLGDNSIVPILKDLPNPTNNYLFRNPGVMVGEFKLEENDPYQPFILEQITADEYEVFLTDEEFATSFFVRELQRALDTDEDIILSNNPNESNNFLEMSPGLATGEFKLPGWNHYEEYMIMYDPNDYYQCETVLPYLAVDQVLRDAIIDELGAEPDEVLMDTPMKSNNYHRLEGMDSEYETYQVPFRYNEESFKAIISFDDLENPATVTIQSA